MAFRNPVDIDALNARARGSMVENLGIVVTEAGDDWLRGTMPVDARTKQPYGLLHGGASVALAETLGSMAGGLCVDSDQGSRGRIWRSTPTICAPFARARSPAPPAPLHVGRSTHVWEIRIENEAGKPVCISRITLAVVPAA